MFKNQNISALFFISLEHWHIDDFIVIFLMALAKLVFSVPSYWSRAYYVLDTDVGRADTAPK